ARRRMPSLTVRGNSLGGRICPSLAFLLKSSGWRHGNGEILRHPDSPHLGWPSKKPSRASAAAPERASARYALWNRAQQHIRLRWYCAEHLAVDADQLLDLKIGDAAGHVAVDEKLDLIQLRGV